MLLDELNECKGKLNNETAKVEELEEKLKASEKHTDRIRNPIVAGIIISFVINTFGHMIMNPLVVLGSLLILVAEIPGYVVFMIRDGKSAKIEEELNKSKENVKKYEEELERLNERMEVEQVIQENEKNKEYRGPINSDLYRRDNCLKNMNAR